MHVNYDDKRQAAVSEATLFIVDKASAARHSRENQSLSRNAGIDYVIGRQ